MRKDNTSVPERPLAQIAAELWDGARAGAASLIEEMRAGEGNNQDDVVLTFKFNWSQTRPKTRRPL